MNVPDYQVGDLVILKPGLWKDDVVRTGVIIELMFHSDVRAAHRAAFACSTLDEAKQKLQAVVDGKTIAWKGHFARFDSAGAAK